MKIKLQRSVSDYMDVLYENPNIGTIFKPEPPFDEYTRGIVWYDKPTSRRYVRLHTPAVENDGIRFPSKKTLVSRYLYAVKLFKEKGLLIPEGYEVDHRDDDRWNDTYNNFQLLTSEENLKKSGLYPGRLFFRMICPVCLTQWDVEKDGTSLHHNGEYEHHVHHCSPECKIIFRATLRSPMKFYTLRLWIAQRQLYQVIRKWKEENRIKIIETVCTEMLDFNLAEVIGYPLIYDTPQLLPLAEQCKLAMKLRAEGKNWYEVANIFQMSYFGVYNRFSKLIETGEKSS